MNDDSGALSIDLLVGFTIFILAFIWVSTMIPNLFLGLSSHAIDYDAVAYRTGVILAEDPGDVSAAEKAKASPLEWQELSDAGKPDVERMGLAISKDSPNILSQDKISRFFNQTAFSYPDDYRQRVVFGDYPYRFNISLTITNDNRVLSVGDVIPNDQSFGYIRRNVLIKGWSNATINGSQPLPGQGCVTFNMYTVMINSTELRYGTVRDPAIQIIPQTDQIVINLTNLTESMNNSYGNPDPIEINLSRIQFWQCSYGCPSLSDASGIIDFTNSTYINGSSVPVNPPVFLGNNRTAKMNVSLFFKPRTLASIADTNTLFINLTFGINPPQQFQNNTWRGEPFDYNYTSTHVTPPFLKDGILEVAVW